MVGVHHNSQNSAPQIQRFTKFVVRYVVSVLPFSVVPTLLSAVMMTKAVSISENHGTALEGDLRLFAPGVDFGDHAWVSKAKADMFAARAPS